MPSKCTSSWSWKKILLLIVGLFISLVIIVAACIVIYTRTQNQLETKSWKGKGTSKYLKEIIIGRCYNYLTINPAIGEKDCYGIWEEFAKAVYQKKPCNITEENYRHLTELAGQTIPCHKSLLWSKTNYLVHRYTKATQDFLTLENTLLGYLADGLSWCGKSHSSGMNFQSCPDWNECDNNSVSSFWKMASAAFARASCGVVNIMLNGSAYGGVTRNESILRTIEIPNLNPRTVSEVRIWVMNDLNDHNRNSCNSESLMELKHYIEEHNLTSSCVNNYRPAQLLQCIENPEHAACNLCTKNIKRSIPQKYS